MKLLRHIQQQRGFIMNVIKRTTARMEAYRATNKKPCKSYATEAAAEKATLKVAQITANQFVMSGTPAPAPYIVFYNEAWERWVGAIDINACLRRPNSCGGYIGITSDLGFFSY